MLKDSKQLLEKPLFEELGSPGYPVRIYQLLLQNSSRGFWLEIALLVSRSLEFPACVISIALLKSAVFSETQLVVIVNAIVDDIS